MDWESRFDAERIRYDAERSRSRRLEDQVFALRDENWTLRQRVRELERQLAHGNNAATAGSSGVVAAEKATAVKKPKGANDDGSGGSGRVLDDAMERISGAVASSYGAAIPAATATPARCANDGANEEAIEAARKGRQSPVAPAAASEVDCNDHAADTTASTVNLSQEEYTAGTSSPTTKDEMEDDDDDDDDDAARQRLEATIQSHQRAQAEREGAWAAACARRAREDAQEEVGSTVKDRWDQIKREEHLNFATAAVVAAGRGAEEEKKDSEEDSEDTLERMSRQMEEQAAVKSTTKSQTNANANANAHAHANYVAGSNHSAGGATSTTKGILRIPHRDNNRPHDDDEYRSISSFSESITTSQSRTSRKSRTGTGTGTGAGDGEDNLVDRGEGQAAKDDGHRDDETRRSRQRMRVVAVARKVIAQRISSKGSREMGSLAHAAVEAEANTSKGGGGGGGSSAQRKETKTSSRGLVLDAGGNYNAHPLKSQRSTGTVDNTDIPAIIAVKSDDADDDGPATPSSRSANVANNIAAVVDKMREERKDAATQRHGCQTLAKLAVYAKNAASIVQADGVATTVRAMARHPDDPLLQEAACSVLWNVARRSEANKETIADTQGVAAILTAMDNHPKERVIQENAAGALWNLACRSERNKSAIYEYSGLRILVEIMMIYSNVAGICEHISGVFWNLSWQNEPRRIAVREAGAIPLILNALRRHVRRVGVCEQCCGAIWNSALNYDNRKAILAANGVKTLLVAMKSHELMSGIIEHGIGALWNLSQEEDGALAIIDAGGVGAIVNMMKKHIEVENVQEEACGALSFLAAYDNDAGMNVVEEELGFASLIAAMKRHPRNESIQENAVLALVKLSESAETAMFLKSKNVRLLLKSAKRNFPVSCSENVTYLCTL